MRTILAHLFHRFNFTLAPPTADHDPAKYMGINRGTMGPQVMGSGGIMTHNHDSITTRLRYAMRIGYRNQRLDLSPLLSTLRTTTTPHALLPLSDAAPRTTRTSVASTNAPTAPFAQCMACIATQRRADD